MKPINITNEQFHEGSVSERTVLIAYDTLFLLERYPRFVPTVGVYGLLAFSERLDFNERQEVDLKSSLDTISHCNLCAKGFALISKIRLNGSAIIEAEDSFTISLSEEDHIKPNLVPEYMEEDTYYMIESLFEGGNFLRRHYYREISIHKYLEAWAKYVSGNSLPSRQVRPKFKLAQICRNLILNKGIIDFKYHPNLEALLDWDQKTNSIVWDDLDPVTLI